MQVCKVAKQGALDALAAAKPGRPGQTLEQAQLAEAKAEIERLRATVTEQAVVLHLHEGKPVGTERRPGPFPGWTRTSRPACSTSSTTPPRVVGRPGGRADCSTSMKTERPAGPGDAASIASMTPAPLHGLLDAEREAILSLFEAWSEVDRSHRKLAHRGRGWIWSTSPGPRPSLPAAITLPGSLT